jgi:hypothetical protein
MVRNGLEKVDRCLGDVFARQKNRDTGWVRQIILGGIAPDVVRELICTD